MGADPRCANETSTPPPMGETENVGCHTFCNDQCPGAVNSSRLGACVGPAREYARSSSETFGRVHDGRRRVARLRGQTAKNGSSGMECSWRQTGSCNPNGAREPDRDQPCD